MIPLNFGLLCACSCLVQPAEAANLKRKNRAIHRDKDGGARLRGCGDIAARKTPFFRNFREIHHHPSFDKHFLRHFYAVFRDETSKLDRKEVTECENEIFKKSILWPNFAMPSPLNLHAQCGPPVFSLHRNKTAAAAIEPACFMSAAKHRIQHVHVQSDKTSTKKNYPHSNDDDKTD